MSAQAATDGSLSIGEVLHLLKADFPDVSLSKIRYLEGEGLVEPQRTSSGYRKFTRVDAERLRYVLRMQRDHYLPLKVIREHLDKLDRGMAPPPLDAEDPAPRPVVVVTGQPVAEDLVPDGADLRLSRRELLEESGLSNDALRELESFNLVAPVPGTSHFDAAALQVARLSRQLSEYGFGPRHLRPFRLAVDRELALVEQVVLPIARGRHQDSMARAEETARNIATLSLQLHVTLLKVGLPGTIGR